MNKKLSLSYLKQCEMLSRLYRIKRYNCAQDYSRISPSSRGYFINLSKRVKKYIRLFERGLATMQGNPQSTPYACCNHNTDVKRWIKTFIINGEKAGSLKLIE